jgi:hypothetical protein
MGYILLMKITNSRVKLSEYLSSCKLAEWSLPIDKIKQLSILTELHKNVDFGTGLNNLVNSGNMLMLELHVDFNLPPDFYQLTVIIFGFFDNFDSNWHFCVQLNSLMHHSKTSFPKLPPQFIMPHYSTLHPMKSSQHIQSI